MWLKSKNIHLTKASNYSNPPFLCNVEMISESPNFCSILLEDEKGCHIHPEIVFRYWVSMKVDRVNDEKAGRSARTYIQQLCEDTGCCPEDLPEEINDREKWRERVRDVRATSTTWWWLLLFRLCHNIIYICYFVAPCLFLLWHNHYSFILFCRQKRFSFSLKVSFS